MTNISIMEKAPTETRDFRNQRPWKNMQIPQIAVTIIPLDLI